jgi:hypothetical protein
MVAADMFSQQEARRGGIALDRSRKGLRGGHNWVDEIPNLVVG